MSTEPSANGSSMPLPTTVPGAMSPSPASSPTSASRAKYVAPGVAEGVAEVAGAAAHVEEHPAVQVDVAGELADGVLGDRRVEARRVGLLVAELAQQPDGASQGGPPGSHGLDGEVGLGTRRPYGARLGTGHAAAAVVAQVTTARH